MAKLGSYLWQAIEQGWAVPHFNISDLATLRGIAKAAAHLKSPVMIGTSEGERKFIGLREAVALVQAAAQQFEIPLFLNADHSVSLESAMAAIDHGYNSIHIDLSRKSFEENVKETTEVVQHARKTHRTISIEGEVGYLVTESSKVYQEKITIPPESLTNPEQAKQFIESTGVDRFAPAVGSLHGIAANTPKLDIERIKKIRQAIGKEISLVLHGGSGITENDIRAAIQAGINCIHINTQLRLAYSQTLRKALSQNPGETTPYKYLEKASDAVAKKAAEKIKLFGAANKM